jgi:hypothetical protein
LFVGLNPSTADAHVDDPTIRRCIGFAEAWGYGRLLVGNLFAFRATRPSALLKARDPIGPENDRYLASMADEADIIVAAWGAHGSFIGRDATVRAMLPKLHVLRLTKRGQPGHPLYLPSALRPTRWRA